MIFLISLLFVWLFYVVPLGSIIVGREPIFPALGAAGSWLLAAGIIYTVMALAAVTLMRFEEVLWPALPALRAQVLRRTGVHRIDDFGWKFSLLAMALFPAVDVTLLPLGAAAFFGFWSLSRHKATVRKVETAAAAPGSAGSPTGVVPTGHSEEKATAVRVFEWRALEADGVEIDNRVELPIDEGRYRESARSNPANFGGSGARGFPRLVLDGVTEEIKTLAGRLREISAERGLSSYQEISLVLGFVQAIPNGAEPPGGERRYIKWPIETLWENSGDSASKSVLLAAVLATLAYPVVIVESRGRTGLGVGGAEGIPGRFLQYQGAKYYYCEPTVPGRGVGQAPADAAGDQVRVYKIDQR